MDESESKKENNQKERQLDPELLKKGLRCDFDQYEMLKRCSDKKNMTEWNEWRKAHQDEDILLEGANLIQFNLKGAFLNRAITIDKSGRVYEFNRVIEEPNEASFNQKVKNIGAIYLDCSKLRRADLEGALFYDAHLKAADVSNAKLEAAEFWRTEMQDTNFGRATVDGYTMFWNCKVNLDTDFSGVALDNARIDPGTKQLLEYNIRRMNWEKWYPNHRFLQWPVWLFWLISDYGLRTWRIIVTFFGLAVVFAFIYWLWPTCVMVNQVVADIRGFWHALYFSVVTMTTLGFGDIAANPDSWVGQTLLMVQVILGYVLLGALVTRFAVLFTAGGPAGKFADDRGQR